MKYVKYSTNVLGKNWCLIGQKILFVNHPELFVKALEERVSIAGDEVDVFLKYLDTEGFKPRRILDLGHRDDAKRKESSALRRKHTERGETSRNKMIKRPRISRTLANVMMRKFCGI